MNDEDPYLAELLGRAPRRACQTSVPQSIAYPMEDGEFGIVRNLTESDASFMDLVWDASATAWRAEDWNQLFGLSVDERLEAGLPLLLLVTPDPCGTIEEWEAQFSDYTTSP